MKDFVCLQDSFFRASAHYNLIKRSGSVAMYSVQSGLNLHYEVFKVKVSRFTNRGYKGIVYADKEVYAPPSEFGRTAYCCNTIDGAEKRFIELMERNVRLNKQKP